MQQVLNKVIIMGRLCADPEMRQTTSNIPVCRIRVAVNRPKQKDKEQQADFINVQCWRATAEFVARYFSKGKMIIVEGCLRNNNYTDQNGVKHYSMDVLAQNVAFGESKGSSEGGQPAQQPQQQTSQQQTKFGAVQAPADNGLQQHVMEDLDGFEEILSDGEVPF